MTSEHVAGRAPGTYGGVFGHPDFRRIFAGAAVSQLGTQVSSIALPLVAVTGLRAGPGQVGILGALTTVAFVVIGLPAGAWVDRLPRRPVMIASDLFRAALLGSVPLAWALGVLSLVQLYGVALCCGACTVFFDVAAQSLLPHVVTRDRLTPANSALVSMNAVGDVAGRGVGGFLVQVLTAPGAIVADCVSYVWSAAWVWRVRGRETPRDSAHRPHLGTEMREGLRFVLSHPILRVIAIKGALHNVAFQMCVTVLPIVFVRQLHLPAAALGVYLATGAVGTLIGARLAIPATRRLGSGRAVWILGAALTPAAFLVPGLGRGSWLWISAGAWLLSMLKVGIDNVVLVSFRQQVTPDRLLGRMNATMRFLLYGGLTVGSVLAGLIGQYAGLRAVLWTGALAMALTWLPLFFSPLRHMRDIHG